MSGSHNTHAKASPSDYKRWSTCPGALTLESAMSDILPKDNDGGAAAQEGTRLHDLAESVLRNETTMWELSDDDFDAIGGYINHCQALRGTTSIEAKVPLFYSPDETGTADFIAYEGSNIHIVDLKTGRIQVDPVGNMQLLIYAMGVIKPTTSNVTMTIWQGGDAKTWTTTADELRMLAEDVATQAAAAMDDSITTLVPSDDACQWCKVQAYCKAHSEQTINLLDEVADAEPLERVTDAKLVQILSNSAKITKYIKEVESTLFKRADAGEEIEGVTLKQGRRGSKAWRKDVDPVALMTSAGIAAADAVTSKPITPTQAMKLNKDIDGWYQPDGKMKIVAGASDNPVDYFESV